MTDNSNIQTTSKKKSGIVFVIIVIVAFVLISKQEPVKTVDCTPALIQQKPDVIMLGAWWCSYCYQAKEYFQKNNVHYCEYDMENTEVGRQLYEENGGGAVPLLLIGDYRLRGFNPKMVEEAIALLHSNKPSEKK